MIKLGFIPVNLKQNSNQLSGNFQITLDQQKLFILEVLPNKLFLLSFLSKSCYHCFKKNIEQSMLFGTISSRAYLLEVIADLRKRNPNFYIFFPQGNASLHTALLTINFLKRRKKKRYILIFIYSLDLAPNG